jgi:hypothetical protein
MLDELQLTYTSYNGQNLSSPAVSVIRGSTVLLFIIIIIIVVLAINIIVFLVLFLQIFLALHRYYHVLKIRFFYFINQDAVE